MSGVGVAAIEVDAAAAKVLGEGTASPQDRLALPAPAQWSERESTAVTLGSAKVALTWLALGVERVWTGAGTASPGREPVKAALR